MRTLFRLFGGSVKGKGKGEGKGGGSGDSEGRDYILKKKTENSRSSHI